ncbi:aaa family atpase [Fusarium sporotrichioides]|uniref:Aaa family atpase n=1 Tax=Fusarium sporotrichioides TaxID=5514 RepID=A0A395SCJ5_FUSSP|nr:aaa family atpase [Fusarium sporotrichioides]
MHEPSGQPDTITSSPRSTQTRTNDSLKAESLMDLVNERDSGVSSEIQSTIEILTERVVKIERAVEKLTNCCPKPPPPAKPSKFITANSVKACPKSEPPVKEGSEVESEAQIKPDSVDENHLTLKPSVKVYDREGSFFDMKDASLLHVIEILKPAKRSSNKKNSSTRFIGSSTTGTKAAEPFPVLPTRIRIRSQYLLALLASWTGTKLLEDHPPSQDEKRPISVVFLYPFKFFIQFEDRIRQGIKESKANRNPEDSPTPEQQRELQELVALEELIDTHLGHLFNLRRELRNQLRTNILFEHLWLLFEPGDIVYERGSKEKRLGLPQLWIITQYEGGREILNNNSCTHTNPLVKEKLPSKDSKGRLSNFSISGFWLDSNGSEITKNEDMYSIPHWAGERPIHSLKVFPITFCEPERDFPDLDREAWRKRLIDQGRRYCKFRSGDVVYLKGMGVDEDQSPWEYQSEAIIDFHLARLEAPKLFNPDRIPSAIHRLLSLTLDKKHNSFHTHFGDEREVIEIPQRVSFMVGTITILDKIHHDINLDHALFKDKQVTLAPILGEINEGKDLGQDRFDSFFLLCPAVTPGFVLTARKWVVFSLDSLPETFQPLRQGLWAELKLPSGYKDQISATVLRHRFREELPLFQGKQPGRGTGSIILLQGPPGVGKTMTAEALADHIDRPLYSVTSGELGDDPVGIEKRLVQILQRGQKWKCVVLIDEADVFLATRDTEVANFTRNAIVSIFLRQLEQYSGILVMTTNRDCDVDSAVVQRAHLRLALPTLNRKATSLLWNIYCKAGRVQDLIAETGLDRPHVIIGEGVKAWWERRYDEKAKPSEKAESGDEARSSDEVKSSGSWWSGREIQYAFRQASMFAVFEASNARRQRIERQVDHLNGSIKARKVEGRDTREQIDEKEKLELEKNKILGTEDEITLRVKHFDDILERGAEFEKNVRENRFSCFSPGGEVKATNENILYEE